MKQILTITNKLILKFNNNKFKNNSINKLHKIYYKINLKK